MGMERTTKKCRPANEGLQMKVYSGVRFSRSAFKITDTELSVIAALAIIGLRTIPKIG